MPVPHHIPLPSPGKRSGCVCYGRRPGDPRCRRCSPYSSSPSPSSKSSPRSKVPVAYSPSPEPARERSRQQRPPPQAPKDPYDYIRRTRLKADDWDTYLESEEKKSESRSTGKTSREENWSPVKDVTVIEHSAIVNSEPAYSNVSAEILNALEQNTLVPGESCDTSESVHETIAEVLGHDVSKQDEEQPHPEDRLEFSLFTGVDTGQPEPGSVAGAVKLPSSSRRYRKFQKTTRKIALQIGDAILEETEDDLESESRAVIADLSNYQANSDDDCALGKFDVTSNFADEILSEIYGETSRIGYAQCEEGESKDTMTQDGESAEEDLNLSLTDEILEELYGKTSNRGEQQQQQPSSTERGEIMVSNCITIYYTVFTGTRILPP